MRWELTDEQEMFRDAFRDWLRHYAPTETVHAWLDSGEFEPFEKRLVADSWFAVGTPEELGGQGGGLPELAVAAEQLGSSAAPSSAWLASVLAIPALSSVPEVASTVLEQGRFAALAVNADRPLDVAGQLRSSEGGVLSGMVHSVLGGDRAQLLVVPAHSPAGLELFLVDTTAAGVAVHRRRPLDRSRSVADVTLTDVAARALDVDAEHVLTQAALRAAVLVAADSLGTAEAMLNLAVEYSKQRKQFSVPIGSFQAVKHAAASILVSVESARSIVHFAAASVDQAHDEATLHAATAKAQVSADAERAADTALTMHGAVGYTWEHDLQLFYKRAKLNERLFGAPAVWNERLASALALVPAS